MRTITQALIALGFVGAMAVSAPAATKAQGAYIYGPGVSVEIGPRDHYRRYDRRYYQDPYNSYGYYQGYRSPYRTWGNCPRYHTMQNGVCIRIRTN